MGEVVRAGKQRRATRLGAAALVVALAGTVTVVATGTDGEDQLRPAGSGDCPVPVVPTKDYPGRADSSALTSAEKNTIRSYVAADPFVRSIGGGEVLDDEMLYLDVGGSRGAQVRVRLPAPVTRSVATVPAALRSDPENRPRLVPASLDGVLVLLALVVLDPGSSGSPRGVVSVEARGLELDPPFVARELPVDEVPCGRMAVSLCTGLDALRGKVTLHVFTQEPGAIDVIGESSKGGVASCGFLLRDGGLMRLGQHSD